ncbi:MAG: helix-turn-helix transcriptional regulator [Clostridia bacterium]|nr:helix-turn-helix transcriptional regulator [Clostridia bacterium]
MYFYQRIRDLREDNDKTQAKIASVLKITAQQYQLYESGKREIPAHHLIKLAKFYNVSVDYLLGLISFPEALNRHGSK